MNAFEEILSTGCTVTFTAVAPDGRMLWIQRAAGDAELPGFWGFPGGRVRADETAAAAVVRECEEEVAAPLTGRGFFVDSYLLRGRTGFHYAVEVHEAVHRLDDSLEDARWIKHESEAKDFSPKIPGVENHMKYIRTRLELLGRIVGSSPHLATDLEGLVWHDLDEMDLIRDKFINR